MRLYFYSTVYCFSLVDMNSIDKYIYYTALHNTVTVLLGY